MPEKFEPGDFDLVARLARVQVINDLVTSLEINQVQIVLLADRIYVADQILFFLHGAIEITLFVNEPGNLLVRSVLGAHLFGPNPRGANEICPPMIGRLGLVLFPLPQGRPADQENVFATNWIRSLSGERKDEEKQNRT